MKIIFSSMIIMILMLAAPSSVRGDDVERVLSQMAMSTPEWIEEVDRVYRENPDHPRIDELRFYRIIQFRGLSEDEEHLREAIARFDQLAEELGPKSVGAFRARFTAGWMMFYDLKNREEGVRRWKELAEEEKVDELENAEIARRHVELWRWITVGSLDVQASGLGDREQLSDDIYKYGRRVLEFDYEQYASQPRWRQKMLLEYHGAATAFVAAFRDDLERLTSVEVKYFDEIRAMQKAQIRFLTGVPDPDRVYNAGITHATQMPNNLAEPKDNAQSVSDVTEVEITPVEEPETQTAGNSTDNSSSTPMTALLVAAAVIAILAAGGAWMQSRRTS